MATGKQQAAASGNVGETAAQRAGREQAARERAERERVAAAHGEQADPADVAADEQDAADEDAEPGEREPGDYEGKQHYPKALYGKYPDGTVVVEKVEDRAAHDRLLETRADLDWAESPADHGLETAPGGTPIESSKHAGIIGTVNAETGVAETVAQRQARESREAQAAKK
jgi:hypothetical protein